MLDWVRNYTPTREPRPFHQKRFHLKKIPSDQSPTEMNDLALFFLAASVMLEESMMVPLYARSEMAQKMIFEHIAPHFHDVKVVYVEEEIEVIQMQFVKAESVALFNNSSSGLITVLKDLYRTTDMGVWRAGKKRSIAYYAVQKERFDHQTCWVSPDLQRFITEAYLERNETLTLIPTGWQFTEDLKQSYFLHFITSFVPVVALLVDEDSNEVISLELSK